MDYILHKNGCWDISGKTGTLTGAYPAIDGVRICPVSVAMGEDVLSYQLEKGSMELRFFKKDQTVEVVCTMRDVGLYHDIAPISQAEAGNVQHVFVQGCGMEGPSGCREVKEEPLTSDGLLSFYGEEGAFFIYAVEHRQYTNRYYIQKDTQIFSEDKIVVSGGFNLECTVSGTFTLPSIFFKEADTLSDGLKDCARMIAAHMGARTIQPPAFHWCSWYYLYQNMSQELLEEYLKGFQKEAGIDFRYIQLDAGYAPSPGDWLLPNSRFQEGLKKAAETIRQAGYAPGIWIAPFMVGDQSRLYREHPDWVLYDLNDEPVTMLRSYNEPKVWGNLDSNYYVLDTSHPEAFAYLREVFGTLRAWGFTLYKTDFMFWNMHDSSRVRRFDPSRTSVEILRDTLKMIREEIGEESYLLGCIAPFLPFIGYADGMRIAGDVGAQWADTFGPVNMIQELTADHYFNHIYWQNDPDSVLLRDFDLYLKPHEIRSLAFLQALSGGVITTSDPVHKLGKDRTELLRFITPKEKVSPVFPYLTENRADVVLFHRLEQGNLFYALNPTDQDLTVVYSFKELFGEEAWYVYAYGSGDFQKKTWYTTVLKPHDSILLFLSAKPFEHAPKHLWEW